MHKEQEQETRLNFQEYDDDDDDDLCMLVGNRRYTAQWHDAADWIQLQFV